MNRETKTVVSDGALGDYDIELRGGVYGATHLYSRVWKRGITKDFDRIKRGRWDLIREGLNACLGKR